MPMLTSDFDYDLPEELIAQTPLKDRSSSRLLVVNRAKKSYEDRTFTDVLDYLNPGDALVLNETKVLPARIVGVKPETGGKVELLLLKNLSGNIWECLAKPQKRLKAGSKIIFGPKTAQETLRNTQETSRNIPNLSMSEKAPSHPALLTATVLEALDEGITHVKLEHSGIFTEILDKIGVMPLPPYIHEKLKDQDRYQTVYAKNLGSAAAPTAGLHFTPELLEKIKKKGVKIAKITLHVGLGTFRPVQVDDIKDHKMHTEAYEISEKAAKTLNETRKNGGKIIAVGTTSVRTLESNLQKHVELIAEKSKKTARNIEITAETNSFTAESAETDIFIYPGYKFRAVDGLITNFHLPKSTLLMLVSAFTESQLNGKSSAPESSGRKLILEAYCHAIEEKYRFFSFGDAMLIV